jgi:hypothetical protein
MSRDLLDPDAIMDLRGDGSNDENFDNMVLNLDEVSEELPKFEAIPPGTYNAIVENVTFGPSQNSGSPMLTWEFRITDPAYENRKLFFHTVLNKEFGVKMLKRTLLRICPDIDLSNFSPKAFAETGAALGLPCRLKVTVRTYQGEKRNNVKEVLPPEGADEFFDA